jgi:hypothetical protein
VLAVGAQQRVAHLDGAGVTGCTMPCSTMFIAASRAVPSTSSVPRRTRAQPLAVLRASAAVVACR